MIKDRKPPCLNCDNRPCDRSACLAYKRYKFAHEMHKLAKYKHDHADNVHGSYLTDTIRREKKRSKK